MGKPWARVNLSKVSAVLQPNHSPHAALPPNMMTARASGNSRAATILFPGAPSMPRWVLCRRGLCKRRRVVARIHRTIHRSTRPFPRSGQQQSGPGVKRTVRNPAQSSCGTEAVIHGGLRSPGRFRLAPTAGRDGRGCWSQAQALGCASTSAAWWCSFTT